MNCGRFRFLIQQRFDTEISPQDDRALLMHLERCESCQKFHHQVQQVILAAEELPVEEKVLPTRLEALARRIVEELPAPKKGFVESVIDFFSSAKKSDASSTASGVRPTKVSQKKDSSFPHVARRSAAELSAATSAPQLPPLPQPKRERKLSEAASEELGSNSDRLKARGKATSELLSDSREAQSITRSLGEKFGLQTNPNQPIDDQPLTLAESIRRKIAEGSKQGIDPYQSPNNQPQNQSPNNLPQTSPSSSQPLASWGQPPQADNVIGSVSEANVASQPGSFVQPSAPQAGSHFDPWSKAAPAKFTNPNLWGAGPSRTNEAEADSQIWLKPAEKEAFTGQVSGQASSAINTPSEPSTMSNFAGPAEAPWDKNVPPKGYVGADSEWGPPPQGGIWEEPAPKAGNPWAQAHAGGDSEQPSNLWENISPAKLGADWQAQPPPFADAFVQQNTAAQDKSPTPVNPVDDWAAPPVAGTISGFEPLEPISSPRRPVNLNEPPKPPTPSDSATKKAPSWSMEAEQIQTGTWSTFSPTESLSPTPAARPSYNWGPSLSNQGGAAASGIQQSTQPPPPPAVGAPGFNWDADDEWEVPVQEKLARQKAQQEARQGEETAPSKSSQLAPETLPPPIAHELGVAPGPSVWGLYSPTTQSPPDMGQSPEESAASTHPSFGPAFGPVSSSPALPPHNAAIAQPTSGLKEEALPLQSPTVGAVPAAIPPGTPGWEATDDLATGANAPLPPSVAPHPSFEKGSSGQAASGGKSRLADLAASTSETEPRIFPVSSKRSSQRGSQSSATKNTSGAEAAPMPQPIVPIARTTSIDQINPTGAPVKPPPPITTGEAVAKDHKAKEDLARYSGLFNLDDTAMDKLFRDNLGVAEQKQTKSEAPKDELVLPENSIKPSPPFISQPEPIPAKIEVPLIVNSGGGLFSIDDNVIDRIFSDNLGISEGQLAPLPKVNVSEAVKAITEVAEAQPIPPRKIVPPPRIEGLGRLDSRLDPSVDSGSGRIAYIGKFLLDGKDLEKIGKITGADLSDSKMRILTMEAAAELNAMLQHVGAQSGVVGSIIVGHDGLLIANTMPQETDAESLGVWALGVYMNTTHAIRKLGSANLYQIVSKTPRGYLVIADFGGGLLVTVSDAKDTENLIPLMRNITQLVST